MPHVLEVQFSISGGPIIEARVSVGEPTEKAVAWTLVRRDGVDCDDPKKINIKSMISPSSQSSLRS